MTPKAWCIKTLLETATDYLVERGIESARLNAEVLLAYQLHVKRISLYLNFDQPNSAQVLFAQERNNELVGAKVGGSFYSGSDTKLDSFWVGHVPTFNGSIGFRCEAQPFVVHQ